MVLAQDGFNYVNKLAGNVLRFRYFTETIGSVYDDDRTFTSSGNDFYTSGVIQKIDSTKGSEDQILLEQGRIRYNDVKMYVGSQVETTSGIRIFTVQISGAASSIHDTIYHEILPGMNSPQFFGVDIYRKLYLREGSLF